MTTKIEKRAIPPPTGDLRATVQGLFVQTNELSGAIGANAQRAVRVCELLDAGLITLDSSGSLVKPTAPAGSAPGLYVAKAGDTMTGTLTSPAQDYLRSIRGGYAFDHFNHSNGTMGVYDESAVAPAWLYNTAAGGIHDLRGSVRAGWLSAAQGVVSSNNSFYGGGAYGVLSPRAGAGANGVIFLRPDGDGSVVGQLQVDNGGISWNGNALPLTGNFGNSDLNTATQSGMYRFNVPSANGPGFSYSSLLVIRSADTIVQLAGNYNGDTMKWRAAYGLPGAPAWSGWRQLINDDGGGNVSISGDFRCKDLFSTRPSAPTTGVVWLGNQAGGGRYLFYDGMQYQLPSANLSVGGVVTAVNFTATSDARLKTNITPDAPRLGLSTLSLHNWLWASSSAPGRGVIAQHVLQAAPEYVHTNADGMLSVDKAGLALELAFLALSQIRGLNDALALQPPEC